MSEPIITTIAGTGAAGCSGDGGPGTAAELNQPFGVAFDATGNLYFSDTNNHRICRVDAGTGVITTVAGSGTVGFSGDEGPATSAQLAEPYGIVLDTHGTLYLADRLNARVRRVDAATGLITTVAGTGARGSGGDGGPAREAMLAEPNGLALDHQQRRLFIADVADRRVRVVDLASGVITTFAGTGEQRDAGDGGPATAAALHTARAVAVAPDGTVYVVEREGGDRIRVVDPVTSIITTFAGTGEPGYTGDGGPAAEATFHGPKELALDATGNLYVVDTENHAIRVIEAASGIVRTVAGTGRRGGAGDGGAATQAELDRPHGVAVGPDGALYIGDSENNRVRRVAR